MREGIMRADELLDQHQRLAPRADPPASCRTSRRCYASFMRGKALNLAILNFVGGICVLSSYIYGVRAGNASALWGGVPESWRGFYTISMLTAAAGYFPFTWFFLRSVDYDRAEVAGRPAYGIVALAYALILFPSSLWLPLTARMAQAPSDFLWLLIRADLFLVACGSLGLVLAAARVQPASSQAMRVAALVGLAFFCLQTVVLDALIWPAMYG